MDNEHAQMIDDCEARESRLSDWERSFVDSISEQIAQGISLTPRQAETLDRIWEKATERG